MSLYTPDGVKVQTFDVAPEEILLNGEVIPMKGFLNAALYVLTNTVLTGPEDPRLVFLSQIHHITIGDGYKPGYTQLHLPENGYIPE